MAMATARHEGSWRTKRAALTSSTPLGIGRKRGFFGTATTSRFRTVSSHQCPITSAAQTVVGAQTSNRRNTPVAVMDVSYSPSTPHPTFPRLCYYILETP